MILTGRLRGIYEDMQGGRLAIVDLPDEVTMYIPIEKQNPSDIELEIRQRMEEFIRYHHRKRVMPEIQGKEIKVEVDTTGYEKMP